jgi:hypothetical protein
MNISQPFIHRPIAPSLQLHNRANDQIIDTEPFDDASECVFDGTVRDDADQLQLVEASEPSCQRLLALLTAAAVRSSKAKAA